MITIEQFRNAFSDTYGPEDDDERIESDIKENFMDYDPMLGSSYVFAMLYDDDDEFVMVTPKYYWEQNHCINDQTMCCVLPTLGDYSKGNSKIWFAEAMESTYEWEGYDTDPKKKFTAKEVSKFLRAMGMTMVDTASEGYDLSTDVLKAKIEVWLANRGSHPELEELSWKRDRKRKFKKFEIIHHDLVAESKKMDLEFKNIVLRDFVPSDPKERYKITVITDGDDKNVLYWCVDRY